MKKMKNIYLIGFMGSGKSHVGSRLGLLLHVDYIDTDTLVETKYKKAIPDIFSIEGEDAFRSYESDTLRNIPKENCIISTGGGIVKDKRNIDFMEETGLIVYLDTSFDVIDDRLRLDDSRPLWNQNKVKQKQLYRTREALYLSCAKLTISTDNKSVEAVALEIKSYIESEQLTE